MFAAIDLTDFTASATDLGVAVGVVGAASVVAYVGTKGFGFVRRWIGTLFGASTGKAGG